MDLDMAVWKQSFTDEGEEIYVSGNGSNLISENERINNVVVG